jgi:hypothetical protein
VKVAADQDLPIRLHRYRLDKTVRARIEGRVHRAVGVEPPDVVSHRRAGPTAQVGEPAADDDLAIRLHRDGPDDLVRARIEAGIHGLRARDGGRTQDGDRTRQDR